MCYVEIKHGEAEGRFTASADPLTHIKTTYLIFMWIFFFFPTYPDLGNM